VRGERLDLGDIDGGRRDLARLQRAVERRLVDDSAARGVHENRRRLHALEGGLVEHVAGLGCERHMHADEVRLGEQLLEGGVLDPQLRFYLRLARPAVVEDADVEATCPPRDRCAGLGRQLGQELEALPGAVGDLGAGNVLPDPLLKVGENPPVGARETRFGHPAADDTRRTGRWLRECALTWFASSGRRFPWRETNDPYRVLVGELLLQRTRADLAKLVDDFAAHQKLATLMAPWHVNMWTDARPAYDRSACGYCPFNPICQAEITGANRLEVEEAMFYEHERGMPGGDND
jgi:hypothetical protein